MFVDHMVCFLERPSWWWPVLAPLKSQNALKMGSSGTKKRVKNGSKMCFSKNDPRTFGVHKEVKCALFEAITRHFGHSEIPKCLTNGLLGERNGAKME